MQPITALLIEKKEESYAQFQRSLIPTISPDTVLGVRTPVLRSLAKQIAGEDFCEAFLAECPHTFFEENQLHGFILSQRKDFDVCIRGLEAFLPYVDNWATCDQISPGIFSRHKEELLPFLYKWIASDHTYTVRFAIGMLMKHYLDDAFDPEYLALVSSIQSEEYYINMEIAWYMATALARQWNDAFPYIEQHRMKKWVHNKTIQKAIESRRITAEQKIFLKTFRIK